MPVSSSGNAALDNIASSYQSRETTQDTKNDALGRDAFLTMLVAQLKNQDPLNPMEGSDFSAQLAQFSQLEQLMNMNESLGNMAGGEGTQSGQNIMDFVGKEVAGKVDAMSVEDGSASPGYFNLDKPADVKVTITDADGATVRTLDLGQKSPGSNTIKWDGKDSTGKLVAEGTYNYTVQVNTGAGFTDLSSTITGPVQGISYSKGKAFLVVQGVLMDPASVIAVKDIPAQETIKPESPLGYLGKTVTSGEPIVQVEGGEVKGSELSFTLEKKDMAVMNILDGAGNLVKTVQIPKEDVEEGANTFKWDGTDNNGEKVADGLYQYQVMSRAKLAETSVTDEVAGIKILGGQKFLELKESGRLLTVSSITGIK